ncbi:hypothetical protein AYI70_g3372, partial [Smittium culicis]
MLSADIPAVAAKVAPMARAFGMGVFGG